MFSVSVTRCYSEVVMYQPSLENEVAVKCAWSLLATEQLHAVGCTTGRYFRKHRLCAMMTDT